MNQGTFTSREWTLALLGAFLLEGTFLLLLVFFGDSRGESKQVVAETPLEVPIAVQPILDDLPLLKLGSKAPVKPRLPEMWKKRAPVPVKRYEERSAPSDQAEDDPEKIPESKLADKKHEAPPEDAEIVKELDQELEDEETEEAPELDEEGAADGVEEGTETDPLKARQVDLYRMRIAAWLNGAFTQPSGIPCEVLKKLSAGVAISVGAGRRVTSFSVVSPSGNSIFDARVQATMASITGQQVPPPPPTYPDILGSTLSARLLGRAEGCSNVAAPAPAPSPSPNPTPDDDSPGDAPSPEPEPPTPESSPEPPPPSENDDSEL